MAFLPELPKKALVKAEKRTRSKETKKYRLSLSNINKTSRSLPDLRQYSHMTTKEQIHESSPASFINVTSQNHKEQQVKEPQPVQLEPIAKSDHAVYKNTKNQLIWIEPFGLWASRNKARRLYEKFSNRINLHYKDPDCYLDPCPHIPRCDHCHGSWSPVKLERKKFRELRELRNQELFQKSLEKYRSMQDLWLQQYNSRTNILKTTSSQARLENFRKLAGIPVTPLNELERLERLKARHKEWQDAWQYENEQRLKNSANNKPHFGYPKITITDYDPDVMLPINLTSYDSNEEIVDIMLKQVEVSRVGHVDTGEQVGHAEHYGDTYDIMYTPVDCCSQLDNSLRVDHDKNNLISHNVDYVINECKKGTEYDTCFPQIRTTPKIYQPYERQSLHREKEHLLSNDHDKIGERNNKEPISISELKNPSLSTISSGDAGIGSSIDDLTELSKSNLSLSLQLLNTPLREADNTVNLMSRLIPVPLGMTSKKIPDRSITSSSIFDTYHSADQARLHNEKQGTNAGAWMANTSDSEPYLQVDLGERFTVQQVATQGNTTTAVKNERHKQWVTKFTLAVSEDGKEWNDYKESGSTKIFTGNSDCDTVVMNSLENPVEARFVRFKPQKWHGGIAMRVEVFGPQHLQEQDAADGMIDSGTESEEQTFHLDEVEYEKDFGMVENDDIMTAFSIHSPVAEVISNEDLTVEEKTLQESKFCVNHLPICRTRDSTPDKIVENVGPETHEHNSPLQETQPVPNVQKEDLDEVEKIEKERRRRQLERARADKSIQQEMERARMAEERRRKLAMMNLLEKQPSQATIGTEEEEQYIGMFLDKYCIIRKPDEHIYERVFQKFDGNNDGLLLPEECLEALENVNNSLLTDSHLNYVFRILELCGCRSNTGTNLRLFSVIAALSQKIVALNDKMKKLMAKCDFKTIDYTLIRVKMLFECYVNEHTKTISRKDLWVGLAAGGLCHIDQANETMEDYFGEKQSFDFLDFLTYLPLFQVIHENVIDNPLAEI